MALPCPKVSFLPAQIDAALATQPRTTSTSPLRLLLSDVALFSQNITYVPGIVLPFTPWPSGALDELYPNLSNLIAIAVHVFLILVELVFLLSSPLGIFVVGAVWILYCAVVILFVRLVCYLALNGGRSGQMMWSDEKIVDGYEQHAGEVWVFVNGVAVGKHWLKSNLDRLSLTFRRRIVGVHNPTSGIIFDTIQCLIQRDFSYDTPDVRQTYTYLKTALLAPDVHKVVLLAHSQGGIIASMALDWLYAELPGPALRKLEVYTFGCAANHFNNPVCAVNEAETGDQTAGLNGNAAAIASIPADAPLAGTVRAALSPSPHMHGFCAVPHIEHYANGEDFVSRWGVLHFSALAEDRFSGRVFSRPGVSGHQFDQHYLDGMFPLNSAQSAVLEHNPFVDAVCDVDEGLVLRREEASACAMNRVLGMGLGEAHEADVQVLNSKGAVVDGAGEQGNTHRAATLARVRAVRALRVRDLSRLWAYRNGLSPQD